MRATFFNEYGDPKKVMRLANNLAIPKPNADEVLVKVECSSINAADKHMVRANYFIIRLLLGLFKPAKNRRVLGMDMVGTIQSTGEKVKDFQVGDEVAADLRQSFGGGFAEYATVKAVNLVRKPAGISFEAAATVPISGQAAMMGLILCAIKVGDKLLINGASGGVGSFGVLIAKAQGAHVTAICSAAKADYVKSWGADVVVDYEQSPITSLKKNEYDAVFDTACFGNPGNFSEVMKNDGRYVLVGGSYYNMLWLKIFGRFYGRDRQQFKSLTQEVPVTENIGSVFNMIAHGLFKPAIQKTIKLEAVPEAIHSLEERTIVGKTVVKNQF